MATFYNPSIVKENLIWYIDPASTKSYSGSGSNAVDIIARTNNTLTNSFGLNTATYGTPVFEINNNGTTSNGQIVCDTPNLNTVAAAYNFTVMFAAKKNFYGLSGNNNGNSQLFQGVTNGFNTGWRIIDTNQGTPGAAFSLRHAWSFGFNDQNTGLTISDSDSSTNRMCIVAFTVSSDTIFAFCNGTTNSRSNPRTYASGTSSPRISFTGAGGGSWNGFVGFFMIYDRALSISEIQQNFEATRWRYGI